MTIQIANQQKLLPIDRKALRAICTAMLRQHHCDADLSLCYVDDRAIRQLNTRYLGRDDTTDVLAFPLDDDDDPPPAPDATRMLGEIVVSAETAAREAAARGLPPHAELALYTIHGLLHLLGYDDQTPHDTARMRQAEQQALEAAGLT